MPHHHRDETDLSAPLIKDSRHAPEHNISPSLFFSLPSYIIYELYIYFFTFLLRCQVSEMHTRIESSFQSATSAWRDEICWEKSARKTWRSPDYQRVEEEEKKKFWFLKTGPCYYYDHGTTGLREGDEGLPAPALFSNPTAVTLNKIRSNQVWVRVMMNDFNSARRAGLCNNRVPLVQLPSSPSSSRFQQRRRRR